MEMRVFALRLQPDVDLKDGIWTFTQANSIQAGFILTTVGSLKQASLRFAGQPTHQILEGRFEILALSGTLSPDGVHLHMAIADADGRAIGGHLSTGSIVYTTAEIVIGESCVHRFSRPLDSQTGYPELRVEGRGG